MRVCYRNTDEQWLYGLLINGYAEPYQSNKRFISFSFAEDSGGMDDFGNVHIAFNFDYLLKQHAVEVYYEPDFMEMHPDICMYVTGYDCRQDYEDQHDPETDLSWDTTIEDFEHEEEIVMKKVKFEEGMILNVIFKNKPSAKTIALCEMHKIPISN